MTTDPKTFWLGKLTNLRTAVTDSRGIAPHKPLMILSVLDLIEAGILGDPWVQFNAALTTQFRNYWDIVWERQNNKPDIKMPFNALGSVYDAVWQCYDLNGNPSSSKQASVSAKINAELWQCMQCPNFRQKLRSRLTAHYFRPAEQVALYERLGLEIPDSEAIRSNRSLMDFHNKPLCFHPTTQLRPAAENLRWHYKHHGFAG